MTRDESDMAAAELALGVLDGTERVDALRRVLAEPDFAAEVALWREEFTALFELTPEAAVSVGVLARIEQSLDAAVLGAKRSLIWPMAAALSSLAAAAMLALVVLRPEPTPVAPQPRALLAAAITPTDGGTPLSAVYDPDLGLLRVSAAMLAGRGRSAELWVISKDGVPRSLGLLRSGTVTALPIAASNRSRLAATAVLAVSIEPLSGSPSTSPTGPVIAKGVLTRT